MNVQQIMEDVIKMQFVQIHQEVLHAFVNLNLQELVFLVLVMIFIYFYLFSKVEIQSHFVINTKMNKIGNWK